MIFFYVYANINEGNEDTLATPYSDMLIAFPFNRKIIHSHIHRRVGKTVQ